MASSNFEDVLSALKDVQDNSKLLKLLINIRKEVDWLKNKDNITKLREQGSLKEIISSLQISKKSIVDVSLSILGNCCLDSRCARDAVGQFNILPNLNQLLKRYPKEDSVNGRVFRIIGNLCQHRDLWANVIIEKKPQIVIHIVKFLQEDAETDDDRRVSEATITMGVRSLREMVNQETLKDLVKTYGALKVVGMLLIKYGTIWQETKRYESILINIVKLLQQYSRYRFYPSIVEMRTTGKGDSIVYLSKILLVAPKHIVKIVMNFLKISQLKSDLPVPEIFDSFIEVLRKDSIIQEFSATFEECIKCLCSLLEHPGNRKNERCGDSIPLLVRVLNDLTLESSNKIECCILIISTLNKCKYNDALILEQIKCNIVSVLNDKLKQIVGGVEPLNIAHKCDKKRRSDFSFKINIETNKRSRLSFGDDVDEEITSSSSVDEDTDPFYSSTSRWDYSPASSTESELAMSWTSGLSPESSPRSQNYGFSESDSDDYSPVCSEVDTTDFPLPMMDEDASLNPELDKCSDDVLEQDETIPIFEDDSDSLKHIRTKLVIEIVDLLKTYVKLRPPVVQLGSPELLLRLIKTSIYFEWLHSSPILDIVDVLYRILESYDYLLPLMQSDFIPAVYDLTRMQHGAWCSRCRKFKWIGNSILRKLSNLAESGAGKGDIAHKLLRGDSAIKQQLVLVIPYIVRNKPILMKLMLNCGGLEVLMKLLREESPLQEKSIKVLCVLASKKLGIPSPKSEDGAMSSRLTERDVDTAQAVTFKLDDGSLLTADRELLSKSSDFFGRLLNGDFRESGEDVIALPNVLSKSLQCLLHLIKCDIDKGDPVDLDVDLNTHLDVIALCDRFLMQDYCVYLTDCVEKYKLSFDTVPAIYHWSLESRTNLLRVECIAYALVANIVDSNRLNMFKNLFDLGYNEDLVEDIRKLLVRYMTLNQYCECSSRKKKNRHCDKFHIC